MNPLLLASNAPVHLSEASRPRVDFVELARELAGTLDFPPEKSGIWGKIENATASDIRQAFRARQKTGVSCLLSLSEKVGLPLSLIGTRGTRHVLIAHHLTSARKADFQRKFGWLNRIDAVIVLCQEQEKYLLDEVKLAREQVFLIRDKVDHRFFTPDSAISVEPDLIVAVGRERRDYRTLVEAMKRLPDRRAIVVASSPWARQEASGEGTSLPPNVTFVRGLTFDELRSLYARAAVVCLPLEAGTRYAAGVNGLLEGMAMAKPIVASQTPGLVDYLDPRAVLSVPPGDPKALAVALGSRPNAELGRVGRALVEDGWNLDNYLESVKGVVCR